MKRLFILDLPVHIRESVEIAVRIVLIALGAVLMATLIAGCSPKMDWREVRHEEAGWKALFPAKPVEVTRTVRLPDSDAVTALTLKSARVDQSLFAVGWVVSAQPEVRRQLEAAMLANIQASPDTIQRQSMQIHGHAAVEVYAQGVMQTEADKNSARQVPAVLWMRSITMANAGGSSQGRDSRAPKNAPPTQQILEIIAVGPQAELTQENARLFLDSLELTVSR